VFVRKKKNKSGSMSIQIIDKRKRYRVVKTIGVSSDPDIIDQLMQQAYWWIQLEQHRNQLKLFPSQTKEEQTIEGFVNQIANAQVRTVGPELIFGVLFDRLGFNRIPEVLFRHLVIARLVYPASKLKTTDYCIGIVVSKLALRRSSISIPKKFYWISVYKLRADLPNTMP
jgi:hypothetical protein